LAERYGGKSAAPALPIELRQRIVVVAEAYHFVRPQRIKRAEDGGVTAPKTSSKSNGH
jgi:hypothetical protein